MNNISICIPAYNRPSELLQLLNSIKDQTDLPFEVIICEDNSIKRNEIRKTVNDFMQTTDLVIKYFENEKNLGYDKNLRKVISLAKGDYIFLSGDDDLLNTGAISIVKKKITLYKPKILVRSYISFYKTISAEKNYHRYVNKDRLLNFSEEESAWLFYRSVLVSGLVFDAKLAQELDSDLVDGTLYYQNFLLVRMLHFGSVLYIPDYLVLNRTMDAGDFGSSEIESKGKWVPGSRTIESSLYQMEMFFLAAEKVENILNIKIMNKLKKISSAYSFFLLKYHANASIDEYFFYLKSLNKIGYSGIYFYLYALILLILGPEKSLILINQIKRIIGHTIRLV